jgi:ComF family protein
MIRSMATQHLVVAALDLILPPRCLVCGGAVPVQGELCEGCLGGIVFLGPPHCPTCGLPGGEEAAPIGSADACRGCRDLPRSLDRLRAAAAYNDGSRRLVLNLKHGERLEGVARMARWLARAGADILGDADLVCPVPLHRWRLVRRGFNQAALLGREAAAELGRTFVVDLLERPRATLTQRGLGALARRRNITAGAFRVGRGHGALVRDARVVVVDDVLTTGATLGACAAALRGAGARSVDGLVVARVVGMPDDPI